MTLGAGNSAGKSASSNAVLSITPAFEAALESAQSDDPSRHAQLLGKLMNRDFLAELDSQTDYANASRLGLHADQVVGVLAKHREPSARGAFLKLLSSLVYLAEDDRVLGLIRASANLRPVPPAVVRFWDKHSKPEDSFTPTTIAILIENGSPPALALFERKLLDPSHSDDSKLGWIRSDILNHRNDFLILKTCERVLRGNLSRGLRQNLVEVLFDDRVPDWVLPATSTTFSPPLLKSASRESLNELIKVGEMVLANERLASAQKSVVKARMAEARTLLGK